MASASVVAIASAAQGVAPAPPPLCSSPGVVSFATTTPLAIPNGPAVVTSTIVVSGAGTYVQDVDAITALKHSFPGDLDVTLSSPAGTVVTLTTDNATTNDDAFDGTRWDDDANPAGQVPYVTNDGLVTDRVYAVSTPAATLVPEEPLGAFIGENPNGTWTLTISDDLAGDGGSLDSWSLELLALASGPAALATDSASQTTPTPIPSGPAVVTSTIEVSGAGTYLQDLELVTDLRHTFPGDLDITLSSPAGTVVTLTSDNATTNDDAFDGTRWDDSANPAGQVPYITNNGMVTDNVYAISTPVAFLAPEEGLGAFVGENPNGTWTLTVSDDLVGDSGSIDSWRLHYAVGACSAAPDNAVTGAKVKAKKQKVTPSRFKVKTEVQATAEALTAAVTGKVKVKLANGQNATYKLGKANKFAPLGGKAKLKQLLTGSKAKAAAARVAMVEALKDKRSVVAKLKFTITDAAGNKQVVKKTVKVKRG